MEIYESCTGNIYIESDGYSPGRCYVCGDRDEYIGSFSEGDTKRIASIIIEQLDFYGEDYGRAILKAVDRKIKLSDEEKDKIKNEIKNYADRIIEKMFEWEVECE